MIQGMSLATSVPGTNLIFHLCNFCRTGAADTWGGNIEPLRSDGMVKCLLSFQNPMRSGIYQGLRLNFQVQSICAPIATTMMWLEASGT